MISAVEKYVGGPIKYLVVRIRRANDHVLDVSDNEVQLGILCGPLAAMNERMDRCEWQVLQRTWLQDVLGLRESEFPGQARVNAGTSGLREVAWNMNRW
jgi:hypothetical protein